MFRDRCRCGSGCIRNRLSRKQKVRPNYSSRAIGTPKLLAETENASYNTKYVYDANGSPTSVTTVSAGTTTTNTYGYDPQGQMTTAVINGVTTTYLYSVDNAERIVSETTGTTTTGYVWDLNNPTGYSQVLETWTGGSTLASSFIIGDRVLGQDMFTSGTGTVSYILPDGEDNTRQLTLYSPRSNSSLNGKVRARYDYDGFGNPLKFTATTHTANYLTTPIGFKGGYLDPVTNQVIFGIREYNPETDRFWTMDSGNFGPGDWMNANLYLYCGGNPVNCSDPSGHFDLPELLVSTGISSVLGSILTPVLKPAAQYVNGTIFSALLPVDVMDHLSKINWSNLSAIMIGGNVGYTVSRGPLGIGGGGGAELLWSPHTHNWGVYGFADANISLLGGTGFGSSVKVGAVFNSPTLGDYAGAFRSVTIGYRWLRQSVKSIFSKSVIGSHMLALPPGTTSLIPGSASGIGDALLQTGKNLLADVATRLDNKAITFFWSPYVVGSFGFSIESQFSEDGSSGISTGLQNYWLVAGNPRDRLL